jgi:phenylacetate-CoA ligase
MRSTIPAIADNVGPRIAETARYCYDNSAYYRERLDQVGVSPDEIKSLEDLEGLPILLAKSDEVALQKQSIAELGHPFGEHLCAPVEKVVSVNATSGTTGDPMYYAATASDVKITDDLWRRGFEMAGLRPGDPVVHAFGLSMFLAGVPVVRGLERMGARTIPVGAEAGSERLLKVMAQHRPIAICCTPSYGEYLIEKTDLTGAGIEHVFCAGEPGAGLPEVRNHLSEGFGGASVTDMLGGAHGIINVSCSAHDGMHVLGGEYSIQQLVDPETSAPVPIGHGAVGVRVKTTLGWQAQPQLRASIGDVYEVLTEPCSCGRPEPRVKVIGRIDDLLIIKGVKLYPAAVQDLVHEYRPHLTGVFKIVLPAPGPRVEPPLRMRVEVAEGAPDDTIAKLSKEMHSRYTVTPEIEAVAAGSLPRTSHKAKLVEVES